MRTSNRFQTLTSEISWPLRAGLNWETITKLIQNIDVVFMELALSKTLK
jgi:hypothetical protein